VRKVLQRLREYDLYAKLEKCSFDCDEVEFLGHIISANGISMDRAKVQTILRWQTPSFVRDVQCFLEKELAVSQRVRPAKLEELNLGTLEESRNVLVAKDLEAEFKVKLVMVLREYKEVFSWSYEDIKGLNPEFYHHKINLAKDAIPVQQCRYRLNPNYAAKVKEEIDKLLHG
jgi:hypothetical protein